jgi:putative DNA primase/helicase
MRDLTVSFGKGDKAAITAVKVMPWEQFAAALTAEPPESEDKASRGWYIPASFNPVYRHGDNFISRDAVTFDFDHVGMEDWAKVLQSLPNIALAMYTTHSHSETQPRFRVVVPLSRPTSFDEFQAVSRQLASRFGIELAARESFTPPQMTYLPLRSPRGLFTSHIQDGSWADVDAILGEYLNWTDATQWPRRSTGDDLHAAIERQTPPNEKEGPVGRFCRAFTVSQAIEKFNLPYKRIR